MKKIYEWLACGFFVGTVLIGGSEWKGPFWPNCLISIGGAVIGIACFLFFLRLSKKVEEREKQDYRALIEGRRSYFFKK